MLLDSAMATTVFPTSIRGCVGSSLKFQPPIDLTTQNDSGSEENMCQTRNVCRPASKHFAFYEIHKSFSLITLKDDSLVV